VQVAGLFADMFGNIGQKCDDIMFYFAFDLVDSRDIKFCTVTNRPTGASWNLSELFHRLGSKCFDFQPNGKF